LISYLCIRINISIYEYIHLNESIKGILWVLEFYVHHVMCYFSWLRWLDKSLLTQIYICIRLGQPQVKQALILFLLCCELVQF
jgi:hypothetical protein